MTNDERKIELELSVKLHDKLDNLNVVELLELMGIKEELKDLIDGNIFIPKEDFPNWLTHNNYNILDIIDTEICLLPNDYEGPSTILEIQPELSYIIHYNEAALVDTIIDYLLSDYVLDNLQSFINSI